MLVHKLRLQRGWSQEQLAELSGLSVRTIQRIERGKAASAESLKSLAAVFQIDFSALQPEANMTLDPNLAVKPDEALAFRQVRRLRRFYMHAIQYVLVVSLLAVVNYIQNPRYLLGRLGGARLGHRPAHACARHLRALSLPWPGVGKTRDRTPARPQVVNQELSPASTRTCCTALRPSASKA